MNDKDDVDSSNEEVTETKRKSRNLSEKKRRDSFNVLIKDLANIVSTSSRKLDKSNVLKQTIAFLRKNNQTQADSGHSPDSEKYRPQFLSNEEYLYLLLENLEAFVIVVTCNKQIVYVSDKLKEILDLRQVDFRGKFLHELLDEQSCFSFNEAVSEQMQRASATKNFRMPGLSFSWNFRRGESFVSAKLEGKFKSLLVPDESCAQLGTSSCVSSDETLCFLCVGKCLQFPMNMYISFPMKEKIEFVCKFNMEWKFVHLDQRFVNVTGYLPFELIGLSGYDYYHHDDLEDLVLCHESIMKNGEVTSAPYRFRTKADRWIWLKTKYFISYHQWNTKPECVVCNNFVLTDGISSRLTDEGGSVSFSQSDSTKSSSVKNEPNANSCVGKEVNFEFGKQVFRPQPGVSIEHSPIARNMGKNRDTNQRKQKQQPSNLTSKDATSVNEETNTQLFVQLQQRQSNLQQQILQHELQLQTLHSQLLRSITPEVVVHQQSNHMVAPISHFSLQRFDNSVHRPSTPLPIRPMITSPRP